MTMTTTKSIRSEEEARVTNGRLFSPGKFAATLGVVASVDPREAAEALGRHLRGDWGIVSPEDWEENDAALANGGCLFSAYRSEKEVCFLIATAEDRSL